MYSVFNHICHFHSISKPSRHYQYFPFSISYILLFLKKELSPIFMVYMPICIVCGQPTKGHNLENMGSPTSGSHQVKNFLTEVQGMVNPSPIHNIILIGLSFCRSFSEFISRKQCFTVVLSDFSGLQSLQNSQRLKQQHRAYSGLHQPLCI